MSTDSKLAMQLECCQTEVEFVRRRLKQTEEKLEMEKQSRQQLETKVRQGTVMCTDVRLNVRGNNCVCVCVGDNIAGPPGAVQTEHDRTEASVSPCDL